jgi:hypothetical protein
MPAIALAPLTPYLSMAAIAFLYYRRIRRTFGRQPWKPVRSGIRQGVMALLGAALVSAAVFLPGVLPGIVTGAVVGIGLGVLALRHTHTEWADGQGLVDHQSVDRRGADGVLLGRLAWRMGSGALATGDGASGFQASPLTFGIAAALVVYSLLHTGGIWWRLRRLRLQAQPTAVEAG